MNNLTLKNLFRNFHNSLLIQASIRDVWAPNDEFTDNCEYCDMKEKIIGLSVEKSIKNHLFKFQSNFIIVSNKKENFSIPIQISTISEKKSFQH